MKRKITLGAVVILTLSSFLPNISSAQVTSAGRLHFAAQQNESADRTSEDSNTSERDGSGFLGQMFNQSMCGLDYVQASRKITTRMPTPPGSGLPVALSISGIPASAAIVNAYAWWTVSYQNGSSSSPVLQIANPEAELFSVTASLIGTGPYKCWGEIGSRAFRADVTAAISGNGIYSCNITGNTVWEIDGITLMVIYKDTLASYRGTLVMNDGLVIPWANQTLYLSGINVCEVPLQARGFIIASDFQNNIGPTHVTQINGASNTYTNDFWNFDTASASLTNWQDSSQFGIIPATNDCYAWVVMGMYYKTQNCIVCTPLTSLGDLITSENLNIEIFPDPATSVVTLNFGKEARYNVQLCNMLGEVMTQTQINSASLSLDVSSYPKGIYFVKVSPDVSGEKNNQVTKKMMKM